MHFISGVRQIVNKTVQRKHKTKKLEDTYFLWEGLNWFFKVIHVWNLLKTILMLIRREESPLFLLRSEITWCRIFDDYFWFWHGFCWSILCTKPISIIPEVFVHGFTKIFLCFDKKKKCWFSYSILIDTNDYDFTGFW